MIRRALIQKSVNKYKLDEPGHGSFLTYLANENVNQNYQYFSSWNVSKPGSTHIILRLLLVWCKTKKYSVLFCFFLFLRKGMDK